MAFPIKIAQVLKINELPIDFKVGGIYEFEKNEGRIFADTFRIWLIGKDWLPLAEIEIVEQTKKQDITKGLYKIMYIYEKKEQEVLQEIFKRMYT
jgi:hypothetical protein